MNHITQFDMIEINEWMNLRNIESRITPSTLGIIEPGIAAAFLYITDSNLALIDHMVSNPNSDPKARDQALDAIVSELVTIAQNLGFDIVYGITNNEAVIDRGIGHGFIRLDSSIMRKEIKNGNR